MSTEHIYLIINKYLSGGISEEEHQVLQRWLQQSEENRARLTRLSQIWETTGKVSIDLDLNTELAWKQVAFKAQLSGNKSIGFWSSPLMKIAASVLVLFTLGVIYFLLTPETIIVHQTAANERRHVILPDDSEVWLNQNSTLSFTRNFKDGRTLDLIGEAFFEVAHDPEHPFSVETSSILTTVVGTAFSLSENEGSQVAEVIVTSGKVKVNAIEQPSATVLLEPGTTVQYRRSSRELHKSGNTNLNFLAWKDRNLKFQNTSIAKMKETLEDYFEVEIKFENEQLSNCQFTGDFQDPTLDEVLKVMGITLDITHSQQEGLYVLQGQGCIASEN